MASREKWNTRSLIAGEGSVDPTGGRGTIGGYSLSKWRLKSGGWDIFSIPLQSSDQEFMKFMNEVPSTTAWLMEQLTKTPSASSVTCTPTMEQPSKLVTPLR